MSVASPPEFEASRSDVAEGYIAAVCDAHHEFISSLQRASALLARSGGTLPRIAALHHRLVRDVLDAHRSILRHRAEVDAEVAGIVGSPTPAIAVSGDDVDDVQVARLRRVLDAWWWSEVEAAERLLESAATAAVPVAAGLVQLPPPVLVPLDGDRRGPARRGPVPVQVAGTPDTETSTLPGDLLELLDGGDGSTLPDLLDQLLVDYPPPVIESRAVGPVEDPIEAERARFDRWVADEPGDDIAGEGETATVASLTWLRRRNRRGRSGT